MEKYRPTCVYFYKVLKCTASSLSRNACRTLSKIRHLQVNVWFALVVSLSTTIFVMAFYQPPPKPNSQQEKTTAVVAKNSAGDEDIDDNYRPMKHIPLDELYKNTFENDSDYSVEGDEYAKAQMLITPSCKIPLMMVPYGKREQKAKTDTCGKRIVYLTRIDTKHVRVLIKVDMLKSNASYKKHYCCLRFYMREEDEDEEMDEFSSCTHCENGDTFELESDFINVKCFGIDDKNEPHLIYDDVYAFCKRAKPPRSTRECETKYNILMLGMDSMSLPRFVQTMTETVDYMKDNYWLSYRGYHKVDDNTFPNLMALLTGQTFDVFSRKCNGEMDPCNDLMIWTSFKTLGYNTAYGEDYVSLTDTFTDNYTYTIKPTDHYLNPFFKMSENSKNCEGASYLCSGKVTSGQQLLDYAYDFVMTYRDDPFFGLFRMKSFSHDPLSRPEDADKIYENFLNRLFYTGALKNTFIIFFSEHGVMYGKDRMKTEGYYDDRMPVLFILPPTYFKAEYPEMSKAMTINQFRLVTPYDVHKTILNICKISRCQQNDAIRVTYKKFDNHETLFKVIPGNRTCQDLFIDEKWCSCHKLYPLDEHDTEGFKAIQFFVEYLQNRTTSVVTKGCTACLNLNLDSVVRIHFYYDSDKITLYYVIAIKMMPGEIVYEATIMRRGFDMELVGPVSMISGKKEGLGACVINKNDNIFCVCNNEC